MSHLVKIANGLTNVEVGSQRGDAGQILTITDDEYRAIPAANLDGNPLIDLGEDQVGTDTFSLPIDLASMVAGAADVVTHVPMRGHGSIRSVVLVVAVVGAGAGATKALHLAINDVDVTGGVLTATLANTNTVGAVILGTAITDNNTYNDGDLLSVKAAAGTVFTAGRATLLVSTQ